MATEIRVPALGESVSEATVAKWMKAAGDAVAMDEPLVELETDKVTLEVNAPATGVLAEILVQEGANVEVAALLGVINEGEAAAKAPAAAAPAAAAHSAPAAAAPDTSPPSSAPSAAPDPAAAAAPAQNQNNIYPILPE